MEKRMNKEELIELLESLKIDKNEFWILSSGALVMREIFSFQSKTHEGRKT